MRKGLDLHTPLLDLLTCSKICFLWFPSMIMINVWSCVIVRFLLLIKYNRRRGVPIPNKISHTKKEKT